MADSIGKPRPMTYEDLRTVLAIEQRSVAYPWSGRIFRDCMAAGYGCFVQAHGRELLGYLVVSCAGGEGSILNICVDPDWRRQGIAAHLLRVAVERAEVMQAENLFLEVRPSNTAAIALYERHGFHEVGRRPDYYPAPSGREDALIMARVILPEWNTP
ncbi:ribosomal protein S18-alanine N-acetyltransferase [Halorhodospira halophila]|uniref:ribosomal protein S18-alanine N-acetyltransferase n=1 Tax=Halorhodospira halophila TaxID=1053 RepID=UPI0019149640|nr:ribosomal protein S18-alanine N-acetyltransferase [Halorhodospira halophila]MBK5937532.1 ribosomal-protein-alanine N-acetyltransferase [Halorhodospira halophila]